MNVSLFHLTPQELNRTLSILDTAIQNHRQWSDKLHTAIICGQDFPADILHQASHTKCEFGKWYYGNVDDAIRGFQEYAELEETHRQMHDNARQLAQLQLQGSAIDVAAYHEFLHKQGQLIELLNRLHERLLEYQHGIDGLTGVANRRSLNLYIEQMYENARRHHYHYAVAILDVDNFKHVNDSYGHLAGDQVLKGITDYLKQSLRKSDSVGRYGGEEFLILLPETDLQTSFTVMSNCIQGLANQVFHADGREIQVTASVGVAQFHEADNDAWQAVKRADFALYRAKESGRNKVVQGP